MALSDFLSLPKSSETEKNSKLKGMIKSPVQSSKIFGLEHANEVGVTGMPSLPKQRFLFIIRFVCSDAIADWSRSISFVVKKFDRPKVSPTVVEMKQYNKKRLIQTGVKYQPISIDLHDTVAPIVYSMWMQYGANYFGEFSEKVRNDWNYDITMSKFNNNGYGFGQILPPMSPVTPEATMLSDQYFFKKLECYQLFGGKYTQFDLIHPRITDFSPDELAYDINDGGVIHLSMDYEALQYINVEKPALITTNDFLKELFVKGKDLDGEVYEPPAAETKRKQSNAAKIGQLNRVLNAGSKLFGIKGKNGGPLEVPPAVSQVLGSFGTFDFGAYGKNVLEPITGPFTSLLNNVSSDPKGAKTDNTTASDRTSGISAAQNDVANAQAQKASNAMGTNAQYGAATQMATQNNIDTISAMNMERPSTSQVGIRVSNTEIQAADFS